MEQRSSVKPNYSYVQTLIETRPVFILSSLLLAMLLILFGQYIFSDKVMLFSDIGGDTIRFNWPAYYNYSQYLRHEGIPTWTFAQGLGQNVFPAYLGDVPSWVLYLVKPAHIPEMLVYAQLLKIFFAGIFFFLFLRTIGVKAYLAITGAMLYAFSGFMVIGSTWVIFTTEGLYLALLLYASSLIAYKKSALLFPVAIALIASFNPILLVPFCLFVLIFWLMYMLLSQDPKIKNQVKAILVKHILTGALGLGLGSFLMLGNINQVLESPRGTGGYSVAADLMSAHVFSPGSLFYFKTFLLRLIGNDMAGYAGPIGDSFKGWNNYLEAPMQYCSVFTLLLLPQLFSLSGRREKVVAATCLCLAFIPIVFPFFRSAFWFFQGDYFRTYSLLLVVLQILLGLRGLSIIVSHRKINRLLLMFTLAVLLGFIFVIDISNHQLQPIAAFFLCFETVLLLMVAGTRFYSKAVILLPVFVFAELVFMNWGALHERKILKKEDLDDLTGYHDHTGEAVAFIHGIDSGFYRLHKGADYSLEGSDSKTFNHSMLQGYYGLSSYHPFNQKYYVRFLQKMNLIGSDKEWETRMIHGLGAHPLLRNLVSTKYLLMTAGCNDWCNDYDSIAVINGVVIYRNNFFLPMGITYKNYVSESELENAYIDKDTLLLKAFVVDDIRHATELSGLKKVYPDITYNDTTKMPELIKALKEDTFEISSFSQKQISGKITSRKKEFLFFSIPFDPGWSAKIDGREVRPVLCNYSFIGFVLNKGNHEIILSYSPPYYHAGMIASAFSLVLFGLFAFTQLRHKGFN
ncbi:MAG: hypothetical protein JWO06_3170 [Bacteroidota bacterium]|nr:hypothetical protein [Bacteroidota bacterium]